MPYRPYPNPDRARRRVTRSLRAGSGPTHYRVMRQNSVGETEYVPACGAETGGRLSLTGLMVDCPNCLS